MLAITAGIIGLPFAVAKTVAAFGIGLFAGALTWALPGYRGAARHLMRPGLLEQYGCEARPARFWPEAWGSVRLVLRWLALALVLEVFLQRFVPDAWVASLFSDDAGASIPLATIVGAPMYLDGYAALPLVRGLMEKGMSFGAALALMILRRRDEPLCRGGCRLDRPHPGLRAPMWQSRCPAPARPATWPPGSCRAAFARDLPAHEPCRPRLRAPRVSFHDVRPREQRHAYRARGDLRAGAHDYSLRHGRGSDRHLQWHEPRPTDCVQSGDNERVRRVSRRLRAGTVEANGTGRAPGRLFGGYGQSGNGREGGERGFKEFLEVLKFPSCHVPY